MVTILSVAAFLIIRIYYIDLYKLIFYISIPFVLIMILIVASGNFEMAEEVGNVVLLFFILLNFEVVLSRFAHKAVVRIQRKKKRKYI